MTTLPGYDQWKTTPPDYFDDEATVTYVSLPLAKLVEFAWEGDEGLHLHLEEHVDADELLGATVESIDAETQIVTLRVEYTPVEEDLSDYFYDRARDAELEAL